MARITAIATFVYTFYIHLRGCRGCNLIIVPITTKVESFNPVHGILSVTCAGTKLGILLDSVDYNFSSPVKRSSTDFAHGNFNGLKTTGLVPAQFYPCYHILVYMTGW